MLGRVQALTDELIPLLDAFLRRDILVNAYAIWDLYNMRHRTKFFIVKANEEIHGVLLDFHGHTGFHSIWLRGTNEAIERLLGILTHDKMVFPFTLPENEEVIKRKFSITARYTTDFMLLKRRDERLYIHHSVRLLSQSDAYIFATLRKEPHEIPSTDEVKRALEIIKEQPVYGTFANSILVSAATFHVRLPEIWIIGGLYTRPSYRNRGYATSITSMMVKEALKKTGCIGLYVREDNYQAKRVYEKIGFKPYKKMRWLDYKTGLAP